MLERLFARSFFVLVAWLYTARVVAQDVSALGPELGSQSINRKSLGGSSKVRVTPGIPSAHAKLDGPLPRGIEMSAISHASALRSRPSPSGRSVHQKGSANHPPASLGVRSAPSIRAGNRGVIKPTFQQSSPGALKPAIAAEARPFLYNFQPYETLESCAIVLRDMKGDMGSHERYMTLAVVLSLITPSAHDEPGETIVSDKVCAAALNELRKATFDRSLDTSGPDRSVGLLSYIGRMAACEAEASTGRTIYQKLIEYGMIESAKTPFVAQFLAAGTDEFAPYLRLDKEGNTYLHLAVLSGANEMPGIVVDTEEKRCSSTFGQESNYMYWLLSALDHKNAHGFKPLEIPGINRGMVVMLKRKFRIMTTFVKILLKEQKEEGRWLSADYQQLVGKLNSLDGALQSGGVVA